MEPLLHSVLFWTITSEYYYWLLIGLVKQNLLFYKNNSISKLFLWNIVFIIHLIKSNNFNVYVYFLLLFYQTFYFLCCFFLEGGVGNGVLTFVKWENFLTRRKKKPEKKDIPFLQNLHNRLMFRGFSRRGQCDSSPSKVNLIYEQKRSFLEGKGH